MKRWAAFLVCLFLVIPAWGQGGKVYRVAFLEARSATENRANLAAFLQGMKEAGYSEERNLVIDYRSVEGRSDRHSELARDVVRSKPDVIVTRGTPAALAARDAGSIPVVMAAIADPIANKVVGSLARPEGHVTGITTIVAELHGKRLEILKELLPGLKRVGYLHNVSNPNSHRQLDEIAKRARALGLDPRAFEATDSESLRRALEAASAQRAGALLLSVEALILANREFIIDFSARHKMPVMYSAREFVDAGGLISYGVNYPHLYYRAAGYVAKILKGAKAGELPIEQPTKFELIVNLKAAKALGITVPRDIIVRADEVIQ